MYVQATNWAFQVRIQEVCVFNAVDCPKKKEPAGVEFQVTMTLISIDYASKIWQAVEWCYRYPEGSPRKRDPDKPLEVIAVGFSRTGTESLQHALNKLGLGPCYHGWDMVFGEELQCQAWVALAQKKWHSKTGDCHITAEEFDRMLGHHSSVVDVPGAAFALELIEAYPNAKVIINQRKDMEKWYASSNKHIVGINESFVVWFLSWFDAEMFWMWTVFERYLILRPSRARNWNVASGLREQGKWVFREHMHAVRGLLWSRGETDRMLGWHVEDGWDSLCRFLDKEIPDEPFPRTNDAVAFEDRRQTVVRRVAVRALRNIGMTIAGVALAASAVIFKSKRA